MLCNVHCSPLHCVDCRCFSESSWVAKAVNNPIKPNEPLSGGSRQSIYRTWKIRVNIWLGSVAWLDCVCCIRLVDLLPCGLHYSVCGLLTNRLVGIIGWHRDGMCTQWVGLVKLSSHLQASRRFRVWVGCGHGPRVNNPNAFNLTTFSIVFR